MVFLGAKQKPNPARVLTFAIKSTGWLLAHTPVIQDQSLRGTSSWANTWLGRDHLAPKHFSPTDAAKPNSSS